METTDYQPSSLKLLGSENDIATCNNQCQCHIFSSSKEILGAIYSNDQTLKLISWLCEDYLTIKLLHDGNDFTKIYPVLSPDDNRCGVRLNHNNDVSTHSLCSNRCPNRVEAAFTILNEIRDQCRVFLKKDTLYSPGNGKYVECPVISQLDDASCSYQSSFPSLGSDNNKSRKKESLNNPFLQRNITSHDGFPELETRQHSYLVASTLTHRKKENKLKATIHHITSAPLNKRRIRPAPVVPTYSSPWGKSVLSNTKTDPASAAFGNISSLPSSPPFLCRTSYCSNNSTKFTLNYHLATMDRAMSSLVNSLPNNNVQLSTKVNNIKTILTYSPEKKQQHTKKKIFPFNVTQDSSLLYENLEESIRIQRLSDIYIAILQNQLVPSLALELQLLLRLISLEDKDSSQLHNLSRTLHNDTLYSDTNNMNIVLFRVPKLCRCFAVNVLKSLSVFLANFGTKTIISSLVQLPSIIRYLPLMVKELENHLLLNGEVNDPINRINSSGLCGIVTTSPILNVSFQEKRDSRHNYRSRYLSDLFNNREECRDAFLFQLRAFQEMRVTIFNPSQLEHSLFKIRRGSRDMMQLLYPCNTSWFCEIFLELLLQIGLIPMEEVDTDILNRISNKDKLQKLHRRFTSKVNQKNKSTNRLVLKEMINSPCLLGMKEHVQPERSFTGNQEFFFLFIQSVDSYRFGTCLKQHISDFINLHIQSNDLKELEQHVAKLQLVAKFLGLLVFSPNWGLATQNNCSLNNSYSNYMQPMIPLNRYIEDAWKQRRLIIVIPWVVEYLKMSTWDQISRRSTYYQDIFSLLRSIQKIIGLWSMNKSPFCFPNMQLIMFYLETLFSEVVGLALVEGMHLFSLPSLNMINHKRNNSHMLDNLSSKFCSSSFLSSSNHLDELHKLLQDLTRQNKQQLAGYGASKKLKPYSLCSREYNGVNSCEDYNFSTTDKLPSLIFNNGKASSGILPKLINSFFHQHKDLQQLCQFVADFSVQNMATIILTRCITPTVIESFIRNTVIDGVYPLPLTPKSHLTLVETIEQDSIVAAIGVVTSKCRDYIWNSMKILVPPNKAPCLTVIAASLALHHAIQRANIMVTTLSRSEVKKFMNSRVKDVAINREHTLLNLYAVYHNISSTISNSEHYICLQCYESVQGLHVFSKQLSTNKSLYDMPPILQDKLRHLDHNLKSFQVDIVSLVLEFNAFSFILIKQFCHWFSIILRHWFRYGILRKCWPSGIIQGFNIVTRWIKIYPYQSQEVLFVGNMFLDNMETMIDWACYKDVYITRINLHCSRTHEVEKCNKKIITVEWLMKEFIDTKIIRALYAKLVLLRMINNLKFSQKAVKYCVYILGTLEEYDSINEGNDF